MLLFAHDYHRLQVIFFAIIARLLMLGFIARLCKEVFFCAYLFTDTG
jgi:hypothetical protein